MGRPLLCLGSMGLGAAAMYLFDPDLGTRRRAILYDRLVAGCRSLQNELEVGCRDVQQRAQGLVCDLRYRMSANDVPDTVLVERVRAKIGRCVSHPHAIQVAASEGHVRLSGPILTSESERLFNAVRCVPGVRHVENQLQMHNSAEGIPALQGGREVCGAENANWKPATKLLLVTAGALVVADGIRRQFVHAR